MTQAFDVIIVGTGAGGGTLAHTLAPTGKQILLLDRGNFLTREYENWDPGPVFVDGRYISPDTARPATGTRASCTPRPTPTSSPSGRCSACRT